MYELSLCIIFMAIWGNIISWVLKLCIFVSTDGANELKSEYLIKEYISQYLWAGSQDFI